MNSTVFITTFGVIFLAELGDKTQLTAMALALRFSWKRVFLGIAAAFALLNLGAVLVGHLLHTAFSGHLIWVKLISAALFLYFGVTTLIHGGADEQDEGVKVTATDAVRTAFLMILFAELGDKTQLVTASLAAQYASPLAVFTGSTLALWTVSLMGIFLGRQLVRYVPLRYIHRGAGVLFLLFGCAIAVQTLMRF
jgi:putative Ca2+/H+ antiporter (TMEM165/GDT1 family)